MNRAAQRLLFPVLMAACLFLAAFWPVQGSAQVPVGAAPEPVLSAQALEVKRLYGNRCEIEQSCADLLYVDCDSEVDGPAYYLRQDDLSVIAKCGGFCMNPDEPCICPPEEWECNKEE